MTDAAPTPVPLPAPGEEDLGMPTAEEAGLVADAILTALDVGDGPSPLQQVLARSVVEAMTGFEVEPGGRPVGPDELAHGFRHRDLLHRTRILHDMVLCALVSRPLPPVVAARVEDYARALSVTDPVLDTMRRLAEGEVGLVMVDFDRNGYALGWEPSRSAVLRTSRQLAEAWARAEHDPALAAEWRSMADLPAGTLGRAVHDFYQARGFAFPGDPGSVPPLLAQHDWVHVLADYGTSLEAELEVFAFIGRADDHPKGFSLLAMVVSLFESGALPRGGGHFEAAPGYLSLEGMAVRVADAMRRGALCTPDGPVPKDFLALDWMTYAPLPLEEVRARFGVPAKSDQALGAGSVGPWEPGGITAYQLQTGTRIAAENGRTYDAFGATVIGAPPTGG